jgi:hypothetical protein
MSSNYRGAMDQLICLSMFCRRVGIPHRIYGFTQCASGVFDRHNNHARMNAKTVLLKKISTRLSGKDFMFPDTGFDLLEFFHEDMSLKEFNTMVGTLLLSARRYDGYQPDEFTQPMNPTQYIDEAFGRNNYGYYGNALEYLGLGGTPLNDALLVSRDLLTKFRKEKKIQLMNFVCITDGDSNHSEYYRDCGHDIHGKHRRVPVTGSTSRSTNIFVDEESRVQTTVADSSHKITAMIARTVRKSQDAKFVGFYIVGSAYDVRHVTYRFMGAAEAIAFQDKWRKNKDGAVVPDMLSFDEFYLVQGGKNLRAQEAKFDEAENLKKGQLARAFISAQNKRGASRAILGKFIEKIAA